MGSKPKAYTLNLSINSIVDINWLKRFTVKLSKLQKNTIYTFLEAIFLNQKKLVLQQLFLDKLKSNIILSQNKCQLHDDIWVTGNIGNSYIGYKLFKNHNFQIDKKNILSFKNNYLYPTPCMFGYVAAKHINSAIDISDGLFGDLSKILNKKYGAKINLKNIPISANLKKICLNPKSKINLKDVVSWGDDYELIFTSKKKNKDKLLTLAKRNKIKLSNIGSIIKKKGIFDDSFSLIKNISSFDHFS